MILRWLICSSLVLFAIPAVAGAANVTGSVTLTNTRESLRRTGYQDVVVSFMPLTAPIPPAPAHHARMLQKDKMFHPHVLAAQVGTVVDFPNADPIFHNAFSSYSGQIFDVGLYPPGTSRAVRFDRPGVVRVFCNIHQFMSALIVIVNTPYFAETDQRGTFSVTLPPGDYEMHVYHERASEKTLGALTRVVHVENADIPLPLMNISEAGYLPTAHKNKHGQDYEPAVNDRAVYPGVRN